MLRFGHASFFTYLTHLTYVPKPHDLVLTQIRDSLLTNRSI